MKVQRVSDCGLLSPSRYTCSEPLPAPEAQGKQRSSGRIPSAKSSGQLRWDGVCYMWQGRCTHERWTVIAWARPAQWPHQLTHWCGQGKFHMAPPLDEELAVAKPWWESKNRFPPGRSSHNCSIPSGQPWTCAHVIKSKWIQEVTYIHVFVCFIYILIYIIIK